jgi:hypothetical protein
MRVTLPLAALTMVFTAVYCDASSRPHIVMVLGDDIGFGDVGYADDQVSCSARHDRLPLISNFVSHLQDLREAHTACLCAYVYMHTCPCALHAYVHG